MLGHRKNSCLISGASQTWRYRVSRSYVFDCRSMTTPFIAAGWFFSPERYIAPRDTTHENQVVSRVVAIEQGE